MHLSLYFVFFGIFVLLFCVQFPRVVFESLVVRCCGVLWIRPVMSVRCIFQFMSSVFKKRGLVSGSLHFFCHTRVEICSFSAGSSSSYRFSLRSYTVWVCQLFIRSGSRRLFRNICNGLLRHLSQNISFIEVTVFGTRALSLAMHFGI